MKRWCSPFPSKKQTKTKYCMRGFELRISVLVWEWGNPAPVSHQPKAHPIWGSAVDAHTHEHVLSASL